MSSKKTLCDWSKKDIKKKAEALIKLIEKPEFICGSCARASNTSKVLCEPIKISKLTTKENKKELL